MSSSLCQGPGAASPPAPLSITGRGLGGGDRGWCSAAWGPGGVPVPWVSHGVSTSPPPHISHGIIGGFSPPSAGPAPAPAPLCAPPCCSPELWPLHHSPVLVPVLRGLASLLAQGPTANRRGWEGCGVGGALPHVPPEHHHGARKPSVPCPGAEGAESPSRCSRSAWLRVLGVVGGPHPARPRRKSRGRRDRTAPLRHPPGLGPVHTAPPQPRAPSPSTPLCSPWSSTSRAPGGGSGSPPAQPRAPVPQMPSTCCPQSP